MSDLTFRDVERAKGLSGSPLASDYYPQQASRYIPPGYYSGFRLGIEDEGHVIVGPGVIEVAGNLIISNAEYILEAADWYCTRQANSTFYIYIDANAKYYVYVETPTWSIAYASYYHPRFTYRYVGKIITNAANNDAMYVINAAAAAVEDVEYEAITSERLVDLSVLTAKLNNLAVTTAKLADDSVTTDKILARTIVAGDIMTNTITAAEIAAGTITATEILAGTITANEIAAGTFNALLLATNALLVVNSFGYVAATSVTPGLGDERIFMDADEMAFQRHNGVGWVDKIRIGNIDGASADWKSRFLEQLTIIGITGTSSGAVSDATANFVIDCSEYATAHLLAGTTHTASIWFGDVDQPLSGYVGYSNVSDELILGGITAVRTKVNAQTMICAHIDGAQKNIMFGVTEADPSYDFHFYDNSTTNSPEIAIEQDGTGDAQLAWILTGGQVYTMGIDNSDSDKLKLGRGLSWNDGVDITVDSTGLIGIGTIAPDVLLHVCKADATAVLRLERNDTTVTTDDIVARIEVETQDVTDPGLCATIEAISRGSSGETGWRFSCGTPSALAEAIRIDEYGNLGVGVTDPAELVEIENDMTSTCLQISNAAADGDPYLAFALSGTKTFCIGIDDGDADKLKIGTTAIGTSTRLTIDASGNVGIGTEAPASLNTRLPVLQITSDTTHLPGIVLESGHTTYPDDWEIVLSGSAVPDNGADFRIYQATTPWLTIKHDTGNVGINQVTPTGQLHVDQSSLTGAVPVLLLDQADVSEEFIRFIGTAAAATLTQSIVDNGDVGAATLRGWVKVYVTDTGDQITDQAYYMPLYTLA